MRNYKLVLEYDGGRYEGWLKRGKLDENYSVGGKVYAVLSKFFEMDFEFNASYKTERGVHAVKQIVNVKVDKVIEPIEILYYCNRFLPADIVVKSAVSTDERFHASLSAKSRTFEYRIMCGKIAPIFERKYVYYSFATPFIKDMEKAAEEFIGQYDFRNFTTFKKSKSLIKAIEKIDIVHVGDEVKIRITSNDFLQNMALMISEVLYGVGIGKIKLEDVEKMIVGDIEVPMLLTANGLFLVETNY